MVEEKKCNDFKAKTRETLFKHTDAAVESDSRVAEVGSALGVFISLKPTPVYLSRPPVFISVQSKMPK